MCSRFSYCSQILCNLFTNLDRGTFIKVQFFLTKTNYGMTNASAKCRGVNIIHFFIGTQNLVSEQGISKGWGNFKEETFP